MSTVSSTPSTPSPGAVPVASLRTGEDRLLGLITPGGLIALGLVLTGIVLVFWRWFVTQNMHSLRAPSDWGHAYVIPLISGYLVWRAREQIVRTPCTTFWPGLLPMLVGMAAYFICLVVVKNHMLQGLSIVLTIAGVALLLCGPRLFSILFLPIAYLAFAITISDMIMIKITFQLQLIASQGAFLLLSLVGPLMGFTVDIDGNTLTINRGADLPPVPLNVAEACSGMRMVIAFFALAGAVALISAKFWWQRVAVVVLALPVAILMNVFRVAILGIACKYNPELARGDAHIMIGTVLLLPGLAMFMGVVWALSRVVDESGPTGTAKSANTASAQAPSALAGATAGAGSSQRTVRAALTAALSILLLGAAGITGGIHYAGIHLRKLPIQPPDNRALISLPTETPTWQQRGSDRLESPEVVEVLGTENYLSRLYVRKDRPKDAPPMVLDFHAAYYTGMVDTVPHVPERCFVGGGLQIGEGAKIVDLKLDPSLWSPHPSVENAAEKGWFRQRVPNWSRDGVGASVTLPRDPASIRMRVTEFTGRGRPPMYSGYFFIANGGHVSSAEEVRLLAFDLRSDYAYYLKVQFTSSTVSSAEELAEQASSLLRELLPDLMRCVPDWVEVEAGRYPVRPDSRKTTSVGAS